MPDGYVRGMPRVAPRIGGGGIVLPDRRYNLLGTEVWYDEFDDASIKPEWSRVENSGHVSHATWTESNGVMSIEHLSGTDTAPQGHYLLLDMAALGITGPPLTIESRQRGNVARNVNYLMQGLAFSSQITWATGSQVVTFPYSHSSSNGGWLQQMRRFSTFTSDTNQSSGYNYLTPYAGMYVRLCWVSAGTFRYDWSNDGINWLSTGNWVPTSSTPAYIGLWISNWSSSTVYTGAWDYFRVYEADPVTGETKDTL